MLSRQCLHELFNTRPLQNKIAFLDVDLDTITPLDPEDRPQSILSEIESLFPKRRDVFCQPDLNRKFRTEAFARLKQIQRRSRLRQEESRTASMRNAGGQGAMVVPEDGFDEEPTTEQCLPEEREILADSGADYRLLCTNALMAFLGRMYSKKHSFYTHCTETQITSPKKPGTWSSTLNRPVPVTRTWKCKP